MGKSIEILAPAGSPESLLAALEAGADAVYLGLKQFNARGNAINFTVEELGHYVPLAHRHGTKVYVTLNTLVKMDEEEPLIKTLADASDCGIDGVILQDLGLSRVIAKHFPHLRRHGSTQMAIHNLEGVRFCVDEGLERVVLARELTLKEIREIRAAFPPEVIELEVFCHGAMCYTYSGMCLFSGSVGGRSGNRGECAYTCRKGYRIHNETPFPMEAAKGSFANYLFSMKDMNTLDILPELVDTGVVSLKIEGRRKGPAYVAASVEAYRNRLDGIKNEATEEELQLAFARDYTQAFYQRGQFGDAPVDITATGTKGLEIGTIDANNSFLLEREGIQRYDGIRLVLPNRKEENIAFKDFRVDHGDRHRPVKGALITLKDNWPVGTQVFWVRSQTVEKKYKPDKSNYLSGEGAVATKVDMVLEVSDQKLTLCARSAYAQVQDSLELQPSDKLVNVKELLFRFGDTHFHPGQWQGPEEVQGFLPFSKLKKLRRSVLKQLTEAVGPEREQKIAALAKELSSPEKVTQTKAEPTYIARLDKLTQLEELQDSLMEKGWSLDFVLRPTISTPEWKQILALLSQFTGPLRISLPMVLRQWDLRLIKRRLADLKGIATAYSLANPGHFPLLAPYIDEETQLHADFSLYHLNHWAVAALKDKGINGRFTLSLEDDRPNMGALLEAIDPSSFEVIAYTDTPLFVAEACSLAALYGGCPGTKVCGHETLKIENEHGDFFQVKHDRCRSTVIGEKALSWTGDLAWFQGRGVRYFRADFTVRDYSKSQTLEIMSHLEEDLKLEATHTENLNRILL